MYRCTGPTLSEKTISGATDHCKTTANDESDFKSRSLFLIHRPLKPIQYTLILRF